MDANDNPSADPIFPPYTDPDLQDGDVWLIQQTNGAWKPAATYVHKRSRHVRVWYFDDKVLGRNSEYRWNGGKPGNRTTLENCRSGRRFAVKAYDVRSEDYDAPMKLEVLDVDGVTWNFAEAKQHKTDDHVVLFYPTKDASADTWEGLDRKLRWGNRERTCLVSRCPGEEYIIRPRGSSAAARTAKLSKAKAAKKSSMEFDPNDYRTPLEVEVREDDAVTWARAQMYVHKSEQDPQVVLEFLETGQFEGLNRARNEGLYLNSVDHDQAKSELLIYDWSDGEEIIYRVWGGQGRAGTDGPGKHGAAKTNCHRGKAGAAKRKLSPRAQRTATEINLRAPAQRKRDGLCAGTAKPGKPKASKKKEEKLVDDDHHIKRGGHFTVLQADGTTRKPAELWRHREQGNIVVFYGEDGKDGNGEFEGLGLEMHRCNGQGHLVNDATGEEIQIRETATAPLTQQDVIQKIMQRTKEQNRMKKDTKRKRDVKYGVLRVEKKPRKRLKMHDVLRVSERPHTGDSLAAANTNSMNSNEESAGAGLETPGFVDGIMASQRPGGAISGGSGRTAHMFLGILSGRTMLPVIPESPTGKDAPCSGKPRNTPEAETTRVESQQRPPAPAKVDIPKRKGLWGPQTSSSASAAATSHAKTDTPHDQSRKRKCTAPQPVAVKLEELRALSKTPFDDAEYKTLCHFFLEERLNYPRGRSRLPSRKAARGQRDKGTRFDHLDDDEWGRVKKTVLECRARRDHKRACVLLRKMKQFLADPATPAPWAHAPNTPDAGGAAADGDEIIQVIDLTGNDPEVIDVETFVDDVLCIRVVKAEPGVEAKADAVAPQTAEPSAAKMQITGWIKQEPSL